MIKHTLAACAISLASVTLAQAQTASPVRFLVGAGINAGGDRLAATRYSDANSSKIKAGGGLQLLAGVDYRVNQQVSLQANIGVHANYTSEASVGNPNFKRIPLELLAYYHFNADWRVGGGARLISSPKLNGAGKGSFMDRDFKNTVGLVLEAEYFVSSNFGVKVRAVSEKYEFKAGGGDVSGNHVGLFGSYYF
jgi:outer membrane protein W